MDGFEEEEEEDLDDLLLEVQIVFNVSIYTHSEELLQILVCMARVLLTHMIMLCMLESVADATRFVYCEAP